MTNKKEAKKKFHRHCQHCQKVIAAKQEIYSNPAQHYWHLECLKKVTEQKTSSDQIKSDVASGKTLLLALMTNSLKTQ